MKRTCNGCKALIEIGSTVCKCELGYNIQLTDKKIMGLSLEYQPTEECPKPMTNMAFIAERKIK